MSEANEAKSERATMTMGEAAQALGISMSRVRRLCDMHERDATTGLDFAWSSTKVRVTTKGHRRRGKRLPYADAVQAYARAREEAARATPETMAMGEAADALGMTVEQVRDLCDDGTLPFAWTYGDMPHRDAAGHMLRGHRRPHAEAVRQLAERRSETSSG